MWWVPEQLRAIQSRHGDGALAQIEAAVEELAEDPLPRSVALRGSLRGLRSFRCGRFRVIVKVAEGTRTLSIAGVGVLRPHGVDADVIASIRSKVIRGEWSPGNLL